MTEPLKAPYTPTAEPTYLTASGREVDWETGKAF